MIKEIAAEKGYFDGERVDTIYFGGGTPSLLDDEACRRLMQALQENFDIAAGAEVTLEANPDDISPEKLVSWKSAGINRLSIGVQSFFEEELRWMNRAHNSEQSLRCIQWCREGGFDNFSIDLIYGSPLLTNENWKRNVDIATSLGVPHLSCYALTVEEKTPLHRMVSKKIQSGTDSDLQAGQFLLLMQWLRGKGYEHYEVSNFAKPGFRSRHNSSYWKGVSYLGIGPSAHSYHEGVRRWNVANNQAYIRGLNQGNFPRTSEVLTSGQKLNEYIMISLRTTEGMDLHHIETAWGREALIKRAAGIEHFEKLGWVRKTGPIVQLTDEGMLMADGIASDLFE